MSDWMIVVRVVGRGRCARTCVRICAHMGAQMCVRVFVCICAHKSAHAHKARTHTTNLIKGVRAREMAREREKGVGGEREREVGEDRWGESELPDVAANRAGDSKRGGNKEGRGREREGGRGREGKRRREREGEGGRE